MANGLRSEDPNGRCSRSPTAMLPLSLPPHTDSGSAASRAFPAVGSGRVGIFGEVLAVPALTVLPQSQGGNGGAAQPVGPPRSRARRSGRKLAGRGRAEGCLAGAGGAAYLAGQPSSCRAPAAPAAAAASGAGGSGSAQPRRPCCPRNSRAAARRQEKGCKAPSSRSRGRRAQAGEFAFLGGGGSGVGFSPTPPLSRCQGAEGGRGPRRTPLRSALRPPPTSEPPRAPASLMSRPSPAAN